MTEQDLSRTEAELSEALSLFDWDRADRAVRMLAEGVLRGVGAISEPMARRMLSKLRRKCRFSSIAELGDALVHSGCGTAQVRRQYAQALIEQRNFAAAELLLRSILEDPQTSRAEQVEARGLLGRVNKQLYVKANASGVPSANTKPFLARAVDDYLYAYRLAPKEHFWHGINAAALLDRARRDGLSFEGLPDATAVAQEILATLHERDNDTVDLPPAWEIATALEAYVALYLAAQTKSGGSIPAEEAIQRAEQKAIDYAGTPDSDAFEVASTLRQLVEIWQLTDEEPPGSRLLPVIRAALLRREGGGIRMDARNACRDLEKVFGSDGFQAVSWYRKGLERCLSIARIEKQGGVGHGTGWLVRARDFFPHEDGLLLLTNAHVISADYPRALMPSQVRVNFQMLNLVVELQDDDLIWESPVHKLDAAFVRIQADLGQVEPLPLHNKRVQMTEPPPRVYVIGHPGGGDLAFSLQDNCLLAYREPQLHYRTPTVGGSSGSPVFEADDWRVVALHHAGGARIERLDGRPGTYEANEGISIWAIQQAVRES